MYKSTLPHSRSNKHLHSTLDSSSPDLSAENSRLKKQVKQLTAQKNLLIHQCTSLQTSVTSLQHQISLTSTKHKEQLSRTTSQTYRLEELHFLNKQLNSQIEQLRNQNRDLLEKYKRSTDIIERKYDELERGTFQKIQQAMKRVKKSVMYLSTLSGKEIQKTKGAMIENLEKSLELLKGKGFSEGYEEEVEELMCPISSIKEELLKKQKELRAAKVMLGEVKESYEREQKMNRNLLPQYKCSIEELQKNLGVARAQIAELELERLQSKRRYQIRLRELEDQNKELMAAFTKVKLERKLYSDRIKQIEDFAEQEKERLVDQNQMLKNLYKPNSSSHHHPTSPTQQFPTESSHLSSNAQPNYPPKSKQQLNHSRQLSRQPSLKSRLSESRHSFSQRCSENGNESLMSSVFRQSQKTLKNQIDEINKEIEEIQNNIERQMKSCR